MMVPCGNTDPHPRPCYAYWANKPDSGAGHHQPKRGWMTLSLKTAFKCLVRIDTAEYVAAGGSSWTRAPDAWE